MSTAVATLRSAESAALSRNEPSYGSTSGDGFYTGNGRSNTKAKGKKRGLGAIITAIIALAGGGAFLGASNSLLPPAIEALTTSSTQTSYTSYAVRAKNLTSGMLNNSGNIVKRDWTGSLKYSKIPKKFQARLAQYDIEVVGSGSSTKLRWNGEDIDANRFLSMYNDNIAFRDAFTKAKRGRVATFFDDIAEKIYQKLGISRNLFSNYKQTNDFDADVTSYRDTMSGQFDNGSTNLKTDTTGQETAVGEDGKPIIDHYDDNGNPVYKTEESSIKTDASAKTDASDLADATTKASGMLSDIADKVGQVGTWACTATRIGSMIGIAVAAQETYQSINYFMGLMENISKMKAGYGDASAINSVLNFLSTSQETTTTSDFGKLNVVTVAQGSEPKMDQKVETGSPLEASGLQLMLANAPTTPSSTTNYSLERVIKALGGAAMFGATSTMVCEGIDIANSLISIGTAIATGGASIVTNFIYKTALSIGTTIAIAAFFNFLIPTISKVFFSNAFEVATGIPAGHLFAMGGAAANMREGRSGSGQSPSSKDQVARFNHSTREVIALEAEVDRLNRSPFDTSSPNTFFGSIAYSLLPTITSTNMTGISSFIRSASTSLSSLLRGNVYADGDGTSYLTTSGDCPLLDEIGAVGDLYCNPVVTTDMSTIDLDPNDDRYNEVISQSVEDCDEEGNCKIKNDSDLARYITYCDGRDSPFGIVDQNILGNEDKGNIILNSIPGVSDVMGLIDGAKHLANIEWANGQKCVNTGNGHTAANTTNYKNNDFWNTYGKYYQRYIEDQRILEQMGAYEDSKNPVVAYEEEYEKHQAEKYADTDPVVAYFSRISGLTPENTETMLAFIYYYNYIDQYDPTLRIAIKEHTAVPDSGEEVIAKLTQNNIYFNHPDIIDTPFEDTVIARHGYIIYADLRNRSYAA